MNDQEKFEQEILGDTSECAPKPYPANIKAEEKLQDDNWKQMELKELRKYYTSQIKERRDKLEIYLEQRKKCKNIRDKIAELKGR